MAAVLKFGVFQKRYGDWVESGPGLCSKTKAGFVWMCSIRNKILAGPYILKSGALRTEAKAKAKALVSLFNHGLISQALEAMIGQQVLKAQVMVINGGRTFINLKLKDELSVQFSVGKPATAKQIRNETYNSVDEVKIVEFTRTSMRLSNNETFHWPDDAGLTNRQIFRLCHSALG